MKQRITIHYDFTDGSELPYGLAILAQDDFTTNCLEFFSADNPNARVIRADGTSISVKDLLDNVGGHTDKQIRKAHSLHRLLVAGKFKWGV